MNLKTEAAAALIHIDNLIGQVEEKLLEMDEPSITDLAALYESLSAVQEMLDPKLKALTKKMQYVRFTALPSAMHDAGQHSFEPINGRYKYTLGVKWSAKITDFDATKKFLTEHGEEGLITQRIDPRSLARVAREFEREAEKLVANGKFEEAAQYVFPSSAVAVTKTDVVNIRKA